MGLITIVITMTQRAISVLGNPEINYVHQEEIWKEQVGNETVRTKLWNEDWGYLLDYDCKKQFKPRVVKTRETNPECGTTFHNTTSGDYGSKALSPISKLERLAFSIAPKRRTEMTDLAGTIY